MFTVISPEFDQSGRFTFLPGSRLLKTTFVFATHDDKVISYLHRKITLEDGKVAKDEIIKNKN